MHLDIVINAMIDSQLTDYITKRVAQGASKEEIKSALLSAGWQEAPIDEAWHEVFPASTPGRGGAKKGLIIMLLILLGLLLAGGGFAYYYFYFSQNKPLMTAPTTQVSNTPETSPSFNDSDLMISATRIPDAVNSASAINAIESAVISKEDRNYFYKFSNDYSSENLPPADQSQKMLTTYSSLLDIFDANADKQYQCLAGDTCSLPSLTYISSLAGLRAVTLFQQNELSQAQNTTSNLVSLGKNVTANTDSVIMLLNGWRIQKLGYSILATIQPKGMISADDKLVLITNLRNEHKNILRYLYTGAADAIDYLAFPNNKSSKSSQLYEKDSFIAAYRKLITSMNPTAWSPTETKKYLYDSYKIALSNVDLACGVDPVNSILNLNFDKANMRTENYIGKLFYTTTYASLDSMNEKRCNIENLIQNL